MPRHLLLHKQPQFIGISPFIYGALVFALFQPVVALQRQCWDEIQSGSWGKTGGTDNQGNPVANLSEATGITYELCTRACRSRLNPFTFSDFSQQFGAWLLPFLALISQLPFGAKLKAENLMTMLLAVGSPMLAAYSLALTVLNRRWVARRFAPYKYPNTGNAVRVLISLQQAPLKITADGLLSSLVVLEENDKWWTELVTWLDFDYTYTWSIPAATSIVWVVLAYILSFIGSFSDLSNVTSSGGNGIGSVWLWLIAIVMGWLQVSPKCDSDRLAFAMDKANQIAHVASDDGGVVLARDRSALRAFSIQRYHQGTLHWDADNTSPIFNYARFLPWVQSVEEVAAAFRYASDNASHNRPINMNNDWESDPQDGKLHPANRTGSLWQVEAYCGGAKYVRRSRWGPDIMSRILMASFLSFILQFGTGGVAIIVVWFTPPRGLGCRSGVYLLYVAMSTLVWAMMVVSSVLAHYSTFTHPHRRHPLFDASTSSAAVVSGVLRRVGKLFAILNTIWIVVTCLLQVIGLFNGCYCESSRLGLGAKAYVIFSLDQHSKQVIIWTCIGGPLFALGSVLIYVGFVKLYMDVRLPD